MRLLGSLEIEAVTGGRVSHWERPSARRLVALLLLSENRRLTREEVAEALFPQLAPQRSANAVAKALTMARQALAVTGAEVLRADRACIWIDEELAIVSDLEDHERALDQALRAPPGQARAQALAAALACDAELLPEELYSDWTLPARRRLEARAHGRSTGVRAGTGGRGGSREARRLAWASVLAEESDDGEAMAALVAIELSERQPTRLPDDGNGPETGRDLELARLSQAVAAEGGGGRVLLTGAAGIGKTYLLERLRTGARAGRLDCAGRPCRRR